MSSFQRKLFRFVLVVVSVTDNLGFYLNESSLEIPKQSSEKQSWEARDNLKAWVESQIVKFYLFYLGIKKELLM